MSVLTSLLVGLALAAAPDDTAPADDAVEAPPAGPDRSVAPTVVPAPPFDHPEADTVVLAPGVTVHAVHVPGVRRVQIEVTAWGGTLALDGADTWTGALTGDLRDVAVVGWSPQTLEEREEALDSFVTSSADLRYHAFSVDTVPAHLPEALDLLGQVVHTPSFPGPEVKRAVRETTQDLTLRAPQDARRLAGSLLARAHYPADHPQGAPTDLAELAAVRPGDLKARAPKVGSLGPIDIVVTGDVAADDWTPGLTKALQGWGTETARPAPHPAPTPAPATLAVDLPDNDQAYLVVSFPAPPRDHEDAAAFHAVSFALGGAFLARLNKTIREEHGLTYGVRSGWLGYDTHGWWQAGLDVAEGDVQQALELLLAEVATIADEGATAAEIDDAYADAIATWNGVFTDAASTARFYDMLVVQGETVADARARVEALAAVTPAQTAAAAARWLGRPERVVVAAGDRAAIADAIEAAVGEAPAWIDPSDAILGTFDPGAR